jgi:hypothetical protein
MLCDWMPTAQLGNGKLFYCVFSVLGIVNDHPVVDCFADPEQRTVFNVEENCPISLILVTNQIYPHK